MTKAEVLELASRLVLERNNLQLRLAANAEGLQKLRQKGALEAQLVENIEGFMVQGTLRQKRPLPPREASKSIPEAFLEKVLTTQAAPLVVVQPTSEATPEGPSTKKQKTLEQRLKEKERRKRKQEKKKAEKTGLVQEGPQEAPKKTATVSRASSSEVPRDSEHYPVAEGAIP